MAISSPGIGSNLDVNSIVTQLMAIEQQPLQKLNVKEASYQAQLSAYGTLTGSLSALQTAANTLAGLSNVQAFKATPSDSSILTASAVSTAVAGTYSLEVTKLAQSQKLAAVGQSSLTAKIGTDTSTTLSFSFGTISGYDPVTGFDPVTGKYTGASFASNGSPAKAVTIDSSNNTLSGIRDAINAAKIGVTATIVNDGSANPYRLVLSTDSTGVANSLKISVAGDATLQGLLAQDPGNDAGQNLSETATAQNAAVKVNGIATTKATNTITDVIPGVTLNLLKTTTSAINLNVASDYSQVTSGLNAFVKAYNDAHANLKGVSAYDASTKQAAILQGDGTVRSIESLLRNTLMTSPSGVSGSYKLFSNLGISFQRDGSLVLDSAKLQAALDANPSDVGKLVSAVGKATDTLLDSVVGTTGSIAARTDGINRSIKGLDQQRDVLSRRLTSIEARYRAQFTALDTLMSSMTQTSTFLTQQLGSLTSTAK